MIQHCIPWEVSKKKIGCLAEIERKLFACRSSTRPPGRVCSNSDPHQILSSVYGNLSGSSKNYLGSMVSIITISDLQVNAAKFQNKAKFQPVER